MIELLSVAAMRESDAATIRGGIPGKELMYRAGIGILHAATWSGNVAIVCGSGNNAGDGYVLAILLAERNIPCTLFLLFDRFSEDGKYYYDRARALGVKAQLCTDTPDFSGYTMIADCILGTGFKGKVEGRTKAVIDAINASGAYVVSADINSGLSGDSGQAVTAVRSDLTVSIGHCQPGHFLGSAKDLMAKRVCVDIGIRPIAPPYYLLEASDAAACLPARLHNSNKSTYGYIALIGGSECYSGAIRLAALAESAMRSGAGVTMVAAPRSLSPVILPAILESTFYPLSEENGMLRFDGNELDTLMKRVRVIAFGMGIGSSPETKQAVTHLLTHYTGTLILDADGLNALARLPRALLKNSKASVILTPHPLEFARLSGRTVDEVLSDPIPLARDYAKDTGAVVLLKGATTVVTDGDTVLLVDRGCPGMATAGSGDVLSGVLAAVAGYNGDRPLFAAATAAYVAGLAGELAERETGAISMTAGDTARKIPEAIRMLTEKQIP